MYARGILVAQLIDGTIEELRMGPNTLGFGNFSANVATVSSDGTDTIFSPSSGDVVLGQTGQITRLRGAVQLAGTHRQVFAESDATPDVSGGSYFDTGNTADTITDFDGSGIEQGQIIIVDSVGAITYDVTSSGLKGGTTDLVTADGDITAWIYDGTDWMLISFTDMSDDLS